jgi:hypothetical protein
MVGRNRDRFLKGVGWLFQVGCQVAVLGKIHTTTKMRDDTCRQIPHFVKKIYCRFEHPDGVDAWKKLVLSRITNRGEHHQNLLASNRNLMSIVDDQFRNLTTLTEKELESGRSVVLDVTRSIDAWIHILLPMVASGLPLPYGAVDRAVAAALIDELSICRRPIYYSIEVADSGPLISDPTIVATLGKFDLKPQPKHHVTLRYYGDTTDRPDESTYSILVGNVVDFKCTGFVVDNLALAVIVDIPVPCHNRIPHITVAHSGSPVYSNELLLTQSPTSFPNPIHLSGTIIAVF